MKYILLTLIIAINVNAGEVAWFADDGFHSVGNCTTSFQRHSDYDELHKFAFVCEDERGEYMDGDINAPVPLPLSSIVTINTALRLRCPVEIGIFQSLTDFTLLLNCTTGK